MIEYTVVARPGRYIVYRDNGNHQVSRVVTKDKQCSCGEKSCPHIKAVRQYLLDGGERAEPLDKAPAPIKRPNRLTVCPICGAEVGWAGSFRYRRMWRCPENSAHYWLWYGEQHNVDRFFQERVNGIPAVLEMSTQEYEEYLCRLSS